MTEHSKFANISTSQEGASFYAFDQAENKGWLLQLSWEDIVQLTKENGMEVDPSDLSRMAIRQVRKYYEG